LRRKKSAPKLENWEIGSEFWQEQALWSSDNAIALDVYSHKVPNDEFDDIDNGLAMWKRS
jgi:hypothetical protein